MRNNLKIEIEQEFVAEYRKGCPIIKTESLKNLRKNIVEGDIINFYDRRGIFVCKGYYGKQNKGSGWILSKEREAVFDKEFFCNKFKQAKELRTKLFNDKGTTAFRLFNGEGDGVGGITLDYFEGFLVITWYSEGIYTFKNDILSAIDDSFEYTGLYQKKRFAEQGKYLEDNDFIKGLEAPQPLVIKENDMNYAIYLDDGPMVGIFLDQRDVRKRIRDVYAKDRHVLNTFSYTGAFSVAAGLGGASKTTSVDLAKRSRPRTEEHFRINGLGNKENDIIVMDVFEYFKYANRKNMKFDMIVLDPPSFARTKKRVFSVNKDYKNLLMETISITENNGIIVASTNFSGFTMKQFKGVIKKAFKDAKANYRILEEYTLPEDFRYNSLMSESNYLKVVFIQLQ